jgi:hypothetical protein
MYSFPIPNIEYNIKLQLLRTNVWIFATFSQALYEQFSFSKPPVMTRGYYSVLE